jgi:hypothetical protein
MQNIDNILYTSVLLSFQISKGIEAANNSIAYFEGEDNQDLYLNIYNILEENINVNLIEAYYTTRQMVYLQEFFLEMKVV